MAEHDNGNAKRPPHYVELILTLDVAPTWHLNIGGNIENADVALAVLQQAQRYFETQLRIQAAEQIKAQMVEAARTRAIVDSLSKGR